MVEDTDGLYYGLYRAGGPDVLSEFTTTLLYGRVPIHWVHGTSLNTYHVITKSSSGNRRLGAPDTVSVLGIFSPFFLHV